MLNVPKPVADLIAEFEKLPGIGPKSAARLVYYLIHAPKEFADSLSSAVTNLKEKTVICKTCWNIAESDPCSIDDDPNRDKSKIMVVEEPLDVLAFEKSRSYNGLYHVLHGSISPLHNINPEDLHIRELLPRLQSGEVKEVVLATNPNMEGDATAMYIQRLISPLGISVTRIARGLSIGSDIEYADEMTLSKAIEGRSEF
ncbi:MAG: recombination protein RecR [Candidatus Woykebacteria bacterium RIFCSPHIGHO2_12_FULL_43_10]|uniref:Recombination protein RecR n=2 Tax=Candidatus Woykeibacteriota TaxID=1817899 RepID=A0A1G1WVS9_9BACT|nr:MAG: recombination protein RecR [Candidatus Woykebacteria bacterium RIFCSPHIGHO2_02_FULL_43_16b]OGY29566.1 MAG: recombination protein RecR [Candidatus Woykebacteria bacterium RIFCSPHIGHO2_12_FULL_43_10]OGY31852.1 MAG: recombination protein RecR [Candidatus Woykebacteria bacterium RIFCSPLOWO2_01_FULL_43_14]